MSLLTTPAPDANRLPNIVPVEFWTDFAMENGEIAAMDYVKWAKRGDYHSTAVVEKVKRLRKPLNMTDDMGNPMPNPLWQVIEPAYLAWKAGQEMPENGTPLESWPMVNKPQIKVLRQAMYRSVEDLASVQDSDLTRIKLPNARELRDRAKQFLQAKQDTAYIDKAMSSRDAELQAMRTQAETDRALIAEMAAEMRKMQAQQARAATAELPGQEIGTEHPIRRQRSN